MKINKNRNPKNSKVYIIGSGISSLASAVYLVKDAGVQGKNIHILEQDHIAGGACDGAGDPEKGFVIRGGRMHEAHYTCYWDLLSYIPSLDNKNISVKAESFEFNTRFVSKSQARLVKNGIKVDLSTYGLSIRDRLDLLLLSITPERWLGNKRISDWFGGNFFETNYWYIWTSMFAFQTWSSLAEMRRYMRRFIHLVDGLYELRGVMRTKYNQYDSVIKPLQSYLKKHGVHFDFNTQVTDIDFDLSSGKKKARMLHTKKIEGRTDKIIIGEDDYVFMTNGSITDSANYGTWKKAPILNGKSESGAWTLWETIAKKDKAFGNPGVFSDNIQLQKWYSFTVTMKDNTFHNYMENFSGNVDGTGGLVTFIDSNWLMSIVIARQPHFPNQPDDRQPHFPEKRDTLRVFWGYGLFPDKKGNYIRKKMSECSGEELLQELYYHLKILKIMNPITKAGKINCIPVAMPFIDSLFMPRKYGDRPRVLPKGTTNFAFLGQFTEVPKDCVFTVEYSVRTAQIAVYGLFETGKKVLPVYNSIGKISELIAAVKALNR